MNVKGLKTAVFGLGVSGTSAVKLLLAKGAHVTVISKGRPDNWNLPEGNCKKVSQESLCEQEGRNLFSSMDLVVLSPGISRNHSFLTDCLKKNVPVIGEIELGCRFVEEPIIAITGTNGKTTTVSLLGHIFSHCGIPSFMGGNIGTPLCDYVLSRELDGNKKKLCILELSSFQLESIEQLKLFSGAILNLSFSHGERYDELKDYAWAKFQLPLHIKSDGLFLYDGHSEFLPEWARDLKCETEKIPTNFKELENEIGLTSSEVSLKGTHNFRNIFCAMKLAVDFGLKKEEVRAAVISFQGLAHRLEEVKTDGRIKVYNDAKSTNWESTKKAVNALKDQGRIVLILGGKLRGTGDSITEHLRFFKEGNVEKIIVIGEASESLYLEIRDYLPCDRYENLSEALTTLSENHISIEQLLFSPAFPSFDQYQSYGERGDDFKSLVKNLF